MITDNRQECNIEIDEKNKIKLVHMMCNDFQDIMKKYGFIVAMNVVKVTDLLNGVSGMAIVVNREYSPEDMLSIMKHIGCKADLFYENLVKGGR